jgi:arylformamidase
MQDRNQSAKIHGGRGFGAIEIAPEQGKMVIRLSHGGPDEGTIPSSPFAGLRAMVFESIGPVRHEVSIPFHDSQVRGAALLIQTGWDQRWGDETYWNAPPYLADHLLFRMARAGVRLAGVDFPVSGRSSETRLITGGQVAIVENLCALAALPRVGFRFTVAPLTAEPGEIRAVRAFAETLL